MDVRRGSINIAFDAEVFKLVFLGAPKTGKTSLVKRMLHNKFSDSYTSTVEDLYRHECITRGLSVVHSHFSILSFPVRMFGILGCKLSHLGLSSKLIETFKIVFRLMPWFNDQSARTLKI